ncbi:hypothetical protein C8F01DRAFT_1285007 [Mycena amicta]|nr:hypothetical protein C8F01DRAFT_1285007 [Mycena amicta]
MTIRISHHARTIYSTHNIYTPTYIGCTLVKSLPRSGTANNSIVFVGYFGVTCLELKFSRIIARANPKLLSTEEADVEDNADENADPAVQDGEPTRKRKKKTPTGADFWSVFETDTNEKNAMYISAGIAHERKQFPNDVLPLIPPEYKEVIATTQTRPGPFTPAPSTCQDGPARTGLLAGIPGFTVGMMASSSHGINIGFPNFGMNNSGNANNGGANNGGMNDGGGMWGEGTGNGQYPQRIIQHSYNIHKPLRLTIFLSNLSGHVTLVTGCLFNSAGKLASNCRQPAVAGLFDIGLSSSYWVHLPSYYHYGSQIIDEQAHCAAIKERLGEIREFHVEPASRGPANIRSSRGIRRAADQG